jgi:ribonuclease HI
MSRSEYPTTQHQITFHWIKGLTGLKGNERADYLTKTVVSYNPNVTYDAIPVSRGKKLLEDYYT